MTYAIFSAMAAAAVTAMGTLGAAAAYQTSPAHVMVWEVLIEARPDQVWAAVTSDEGLRRWFPGAVQLAAVRGGRILFTPGADAGAYEGTVLELVEGALLAGKITAVPGCSDGCSPPLGSRWTVALSAPDEGRTLLRLSMRQPTGTRPGSWVRERLEHPVLLALWRLRTVMQG